LVIEERRPMDMHQRTAPQMLQQPAPAPFTLRGLDTELRNCAIQLLAVSNPSPGVCNKLDVRCFGFGPMLLSQNIHPSIISTPAETLVNICLEPHAQAGESLPLLRIVAC